MAMNMVMANSIAPTLETFYTILYFLKEYVNEMQVASDKTRLASSKSVELFSPKQAKLSFLQLKKILVTQKF